MPDRCFALTDKGFCSCIRVKVCPGKDNCNFYKSVEQADEDLVKSYKRLCSLPMEVQKAIAEHYYNGEHRWSMELYRRRKLKEMENKHHE
ncbi:MAG: hypothetical protein U0M02_02305 [Acutalibacteraceae bacterium]|nr:hypothetical protein [Acutalibacteraceae bacterium]